MIHPQLKRIAELPVAPAIAHLLEDVLREVSLWNEVVVEHSDQVKPVSHFISIYQRRQANPFVNTDQIVGFTESLANLSELPKDALVALTTVHGPRGTVNLLEALNQVVACIFSSNDNP